MNFVDQDPQYSIYLVLDSVDMRLGMNGLSAQVQSQLQTNPCEGHIFVFKNKRGNRIKVLKWDATGAWLAQRRLHECSFVWPSLGLINSSPSKSSYQIGEDISEKLDVIPAQFIVHRHIRPQYACNACETIQAKPVAPA